ncbi:hypothetical protein MIMGU_mgv1a020427mg [Erythranthe guttata]|uniref:Uncharacterized protein n=1 Tax=Erythranthe guttata TaxID=4155 RepID=A0A022RJ74_ERYGU|nr:hypothetical protein MIMGU_mgv1a020427mg [Erythranthe guttata]
MEILETNHQLVPILRLAYLPQLRLVFAIFAPVVRGHGNGGLAPAPAPTSDGTAIDQGIAYGLMVLALVLTYLIHTFDAPSNF